MVNENFFNLKGHKGGDQPEKAPKKVFLVTVKYSGQLDVQVVASSEEEALQAAEYEIGRMDPETRLDEMSLVEEGREVSELDALEEADDWWDRIGDRRKAAVSGLKKASFLEYHQWWYRHSEDERKRIFFSHH